MSMQYTAKSNTLKFENFQLKMLYVISNTLAQNIDCGYKSDPPRVRTIYVLIKK